MGTDPFPEYDECDALGLAELVRSGEAKAAELVEAAIARVEKHNPQINAVIDKQYEAARTLAEDGAPEGPFQGVPILIKDLALVEGDLATMGSVLLRDFRPGVTSEYIRRVKAAGFIPIGRTNSSEFGLLPTTEPVLHGPTRNPWNTSHSSGGSSGGAAAATAAGFVPMAHASDGGGSIRIPASACGVFGLKPSRGRMPRYPASPADYLSVDLAVSRSVRDSAALLDAAHKGMPGAAYHVPAAEDPFAAAVTTDPGRLRIAFSVDDFRGRRVDAECVDAVEATAAALEDMGHELVEDSPPVDGEVLAEAFLIVWEGMAESVFNLILEEASKLRSGRALRRSVGDWRTLKTIARLDKRKSGMDAFEPFTWGLARRSYRRTPAGLEAAKVELQRISHQVGAFLTAYDGHLTPVLGSPPPKLGAIDQTAKWNDLVEQLVNYVAFTPVANFTGMPAMSVPTHWTEAGLPVGTHFLGRHGAEATLLSLAGQLEQAMPWAGRLPPL
ncbi:MAG: amidase family protein [Acidimicrobiia bacterium]|nr:amidase family protein [Acidimicrobiia bacterium]